MSQELFIFISSNQVVTPAGAGRTTTVTMRRRDAKSICNETKSKQLSNFCFVSDIPGHPTVMFPLVTVVTTKKFVLQSFKRSRVTQPSVGGRKKAPSIHSFTFKVTAELNSGAVAELLSSSGDNAPHQGDTKTEALSKHLRAQFIPKEQPRKEWGRDGDLDLTVPVITVMKPSLTATSGEVKVPQSSSDRHSLSSMLPSIRHTSKQLSLQEN